MHEDERQRGDERRPPEAPTGVKASEQVSAKQRLLGDACLREDADRQERPSGPGANRGIGCDKLSGEERDECGRQCGGGKHSARCGPPETERAPGHGKRFGEEGTAGRNEGEYNAGRDDEPELPPYTLQARGGALQDGVRNDQAEKEAGESRAAFDQAVSPLTAAPA